MCIRDSHIGRQHGRQQDAPDHRRPRQPEDTADLDDLAIDRQDRAHHPEIDREEHADRDQRDLRRLEDAEPENEQRHPGDRRNRAQRLQCRIENAARQRPVPGDGAEHRSGGDPQRESGHHTPQCRRDMARQFAAAGEIGQRRENAARRRQQAAVGETERNGPFPDQGQPDRQQQTQRRAGEPRPRRRLARRRHGARDGRHLILQRSLLKRCVFGNHGHSQIASRRRLQVGTD